MMAKEMMAMPCVF